MPDFGLMLANIIGNWQAGKRLYDQERLNEAKIASESLEAVGIPGNVAMATLFGGDPEQYALWAPYRFSPKYLDKLGSFGESVETAGTLRAKRPGEVALLDEKAGTEQARQDTLGKQGLMYQEQARRHGAEAKGLEADLQNRLPFATLLAQATGLDPSDPSLAALKDISLNPEGADAIGSLLANFVKAQTGVATRPGEVALLGERAGKEKAHAGLYGEQAATERATREQTVNKLAAETQAAQSLAKQREADAREKSGGRIPGLSRKDALTLATNAWSRYASDYAENVGNQDNPPPFKDQDTFVREWLETYAPEYAPPKEQPRIVQLLNSNPQAWVETTISNALAADGKTRGSLTGAVGVVRKNYSALLKSGADPAKFRQGLAILKARVTAWNAKHKGNKGAQIAWPAELEALLRAK